MLITATCSWPQRRFFRGMILLLAAPSTWRLHGQSWFSITGVPCPSVQSPVPEGTEGMGKPGQEPSMNRRFISRHQPSRCYIVRGKKKKKKKVAQSKLVQAKALMAKFSNMADCF